MAIIAGADITALAPILVALVAGGAVALYTARPQKDSIIATAASTAVDVVNKSLSRMEKERIQDREDLAQARERIAVLEAQLLRERAESGRISELEAELQDANQRVAQLRSTLQRAGISDENG